MSLKWLLKDLFLSVNQGFLCENQTRQQMVEYFNIIIEQYQDNNIKEDRKNQCELVSFNCYLHFHSGSYFILYSNMFCSIQNL